MTSSGQLLAAPFLFDGFLSIFRGLALGLGVAFAAWMTWAWWTHVLERDRRERQRRAKEAYAGYLALAMAHPELAHPATGQMQPRQRAQYEWFVGYALNAAEQILLLEPSATWRAVLRQHLALHQDLLTSDAFRGGIYRTLSSELRALIDTASLAGEPHEPGP